MSKQPLKVLRQQDVAKRLSAMNQGETLEDIANELGITRRTISRYLSEPGFREMVSRLTDNALTSYIPRIDRAMLDQALAGSVGAAQLLYKRAGRTAESISDSSFADFQKRLESADAETIAYYMEHQAWPDGSEPEMMEGPTGEQ